MTDERSEEQVAEIVVISDQDGNYYLLPRQTLEQARLPQEHRAEVDQLLQSDTAGMAHVSGTAAASYQTVGSLYITSSAFGKGALGFLPQEPIRLIPVEPTRHLPQEPMRFGGS